MDNLSLLKDLANLVAAQFGKNCEVVIHKIAEDEFDASIVHIVNGEITMRKLGDGPSHIVLDAIATGVESKQRYKKSYLTKTKDGTVLKSTSMFIEDDSGKIKYIFCINYNIGPLVLANDVIQSILKEEDETKSKEPERITQNVSEILDDLIQDAIKLIGKPAPLMTKEEKVRAVQYLNEKGAFLITKSGDKVANYFGISKYTLYNYCDINKS